MKNGASGLIKQIISVLTSMTKAKSEALKNKTSAIKTRLVIFSLLRNKKVLLSSISHKLHALLGHDEEKKNPIDDAVDSSSSSHAIVLFCNANANIANARIRGSTTPQAQLVEEEEEEDERYKYPELTHSMFQSEEMEMELEDPAGGGSIIDMVRNSKESGGEEFKLEDEIDELADLFIRRFHRQMRFQKQQSFKRYQEMLERSA